MAWVPFDVTVNQDSGSVVLTELIFYPEPLTSVCKEEDVNVLFTMFKTFLFQTFKPESPHGQMCINLVKASCRWLFIV